MRHRLSIIVRSATRISSVTLAFSFAEILGPLGFRSHPAFSLPAQHFDFRFWRHGIHELLILSKKFNQFRAHTYLHESAKGLISSRNIPPTDAACDSRSATPSSKPL